MTVGGLRFYDVPVAISDRGNFSGGQSPDVVLGNALLRQLRFTVDYAAQMLYVTPSGTFGRRSPFFDSGMQLVRLADGTLSVRSVRAGTPSARAGVRGGDTIVAIDGTSVREMNDGDIARATRDTVDYGLLRGSRSLTAALRLGDALPPCRENPHGDPRSRRTGITIPANAESFRRE